MIGIYAEAQSTTRRTVWPLIHSVKAPFGGVGAYDLLDQEYACTLPHDVNETRAILWEMGLRPAPVAAYKTSPEGEPERGSWVHREDRLWGSDYQTHIHIFDDGSNVHLYAHYEWNWWPDGLSLDRPIKHYPPAAMYDPNKGITRLLEWLLEHGVDYDLDQDRMVEHPADGY